MNNLPPNWQTTDTVQSTVPRAKRSSAALIGIFLCAATGMALFYGSNGLQGQTATTHTTIVIGASGVMPPIATAPAGKKVIWKNESTIPHILQSDTLPTLDGKKFATTAIFPQKQFDYDIPASTPAGIHTFYSTTSNQVTGQILITSAIAPTPAPVAVASSSSVATAPAIIASQSTSDASTGAIPQNPYTVGYEGSVVPRPQVPGQQTPVYTGQTISQHKPTMNTESGAGLWVIALAGICSLLYVIHVARKA